MPIRDAILAISPPWLTDRVGGGIQYAEGLVLDALDTWVREGVKARFPGVSTNDSLGLIGNDRQLDQGPTEPSAPYAARLRGAFDRWRGAGNPFTLAPLIAVVFSPGVVRPVRLVSNTSVWHALSGGIVTKTIGAANWTWDTLTSRWWRGWVIIDSSAGPWTRDMWGAATGAWGDGGTWGSDMTVAQATYLIRTVRRWKPVNVYAQIIVAFNAAIFTVAGIPGAANPPGTPSMDLASTRLTFNAIYSSGIQS